MRKLLLGCGIALGVVFGAMVLSAIGLGVAIEAGHVPDTVIRRGDDLRSAERAAIEEHIGLEDGETVVYYYSAGIFDHAEDMNLITDRRVVSLWQDEDEEEWYDEARYETILACEVVEQGNALLDSSIEIITAFADDEGEEDAGFVIYLSAEDERDAEVVAYIRARMVGPGAAGTGDAVGPSAEE